MFIFCIVMAFIMGGRLALTFVVVVPVLVVRPVLMIAREAMPAFRAVFRKYDRLNESDRGERARNARRQGLRARGL